MSADTIDLSGAVPVRSSTLDVLHPVTKQPTGWKIELAGPQHDASIEVFNESSRAALDEEMAVKMAQAAGHAYEPTIETVQARRRKQVGRVCRRILGWSPNPTFKNVQADPIEFSVSAATDLFLRPDMSGFYLQITKFLGSETAFIQPSDPV